MSNIPINNWSLLAEFLRREFGDIEPEQWLETDFIWRIRDDGIIDIDCFDVRIANE